MSEELAAKIAQRSVTARHHHRRMPEWTPGWPVVVHGVLPEGYPWAVAFGIDLEGPAADITVHTPSVNVGHAANRATGTDRLRPGAANCHGGKGHRFWVWIASDNVARIELLTTDGDLLNATAVHHDPYQQARVFLAVTDDWATTVRAARHLDQAMREIAREDLADLAERIEV